MPPKKRVRIDPKNIEEAVKEVIEKKMPLRSVASAYNMSKSHLGRLVTKAKESEEDFQYCPNIGNRRIFTVEQENMLATYLKTSAKMCLGLTTVQVRELAYQYALKLGIAPEKWHADKIATIDWLKKFLKRQDTLSVRKPENTSLARTTAFNKVNVSNVFNNLEDCYKKFKFEPNMIWNTDETGCTTVVNAPKVVAEAGLKRVGQISSAERGTLVTMLAFANAAGGSIPPVFIFPRVHFKSHMLQNGPNGAIGLANQSGWISEDCFLEALKHFVHHVKPSKEEPALIVLDNHKTHITINVILYARKNNLILLTFPPHCSHRLQPLDVTVFGPFKSRYRASMNDWMTSNPGKVVTIYNVAEFAKDAFYSAFNMQNITSGFKSTGIYPLNTNIFTDDDFLPSELTNRPFEPETRQNSDNLQLLNADNQQETNRDECESPVQTMHSDNISNTEVSDMPNINVDPDTTALSISVVESVYTNPVPSTSAVLSPEIVRPFPKAPPRKQKQFKSKVTTKIITSTPEKDRLLAESLTDLLNKKKGISDVSHVKDIFKDLIFDKENTKGKRNYKEGSRKSGGKGRKQTSKKGQSKVSSKTRLEISSDSDLTIPESDSGDDFSDSDNETLQKLRKSSNTKEDVCCVCKQKFSTSKEDWFLCKICQKWANEKCGTKGTFNFFCNLCH